MNYVFPDSRTYQVIARVDSNNLSTLGSFKLNVPFQPVGTVTAPPTSPFSVIIIAGIVSATVAVSLVLHSWYAMQCNGATSISYTCPS